MASYQIMVSYYICGHFCVVDTNILTFLLTFDVPFPLPKIALTHVLGADRLPGVPY